MSLETSLRRATMTLIPMLAAITIVSQFFRTSIGVIAPELIRDLGLSSATLGLANGAFYIALGVAQIPVGILFDRIGTRRTVAWLTLLGVAGALWHAAAQSGTELVAARMLIGLGCGGSFMGAVMLSSRWFGGDRLSMVLSWVFSLSQIGTLLAATPLAYSAETIGWRATFVLTAIVTGVTGALFYALVRDDPPGQPPVTRREDSLAAILRGLWAVWRTPGLGKVLAVHTFAYASQATMLGLWAGPYLYDIHGLGPVGRGNVLLAMGAAQICGLLVFGPLDRIFNSRKWVVLAGGCLTVATLLPLALLSQPPLWLAIGLLIAVCLVTTYSLVIVAHGRSLFPDHLAGRGITTVNLAQVIGCAVLPIATGAIVNAFPGSDGGYGELGYRYAFGFIALALAGGLAIYATATDSKPIPTT